MPVRLLTVLPTVLLSRGMFFVSRIRRPRWLKDLLIRVFVRVCRVDVREAERAPRDYACLAEFFTRRLVPGSRPIAREPGAIVSPVDGRIVADGVVDDASVLSVKGTPYRLRELLGRPPSSFVEPFAGGVFVVFHLRPFDYHRIHMPCAGRVAAHAFVEGRLLPVHEKALAALGNIYVRNRRRVTFFRGEPGLFAVVKVGAFNVGRIPVCYETPGGEGFTAIEDGRRFERGEEIGRFEMGSSVVLLFQRGVSFRSRVRGAVVRVGEKIGVTGGRDCREAGADGTEEEEGDGT